jgi:hypothetical protein
LQFREEVWALGERPSFWDDDLEFAAKVEEGTISVRSAVAAITALQLSIIGYDSVYFQYQQGLLDEELWNDLRSRMKDQMAQNDLMRAVYRRSARNTLRPVIEEILREIETERESQRKSD